LGGQKEQLGDWDCVKGFTAVHCAHNGVDVVLKTEREASVVELDLAMEF